MSNPNPVQTESMKAKQYKAYGIIDVPLSKKATQIKLPVDVKEALDKLTPCDRVIYLRELISNAVREELIAKKSSLLKNQSSSTKEQFSIN